jgi:hypothetical protein
VSGGLRLSTRRERELALEFADRQRVVTRCADCRWSYRGLLRDGKRAFRAHREMKHA